MITCLPEINKVYILLDRLYNFTNLRFKTSIYKIGPFFLTYNFGSYYILSHCRENYNIVLNYMLWSFTLINLDITERAWDTILPV